MKSTTYYLIGEKGTGKTAYAVYLNDNNYMNTHSILKFINTTDYEKFYSLKKERHLHISDYQGIWKVIIFLLLSKTIKDSDKTTNHFQKNLIDKLSDAIDEYYSRAFSPEIMTALRFIDESALAAKLVSKYVSIETSEKESVEFSETRLQINLLYIERKFSEAFEKLKLAKDVLLLIDGIDIRPKNIPYDEYIECIRGLSDACWALNTTLFQNIRDTKGRIRVVLLLRPDIFNSLNMQNKTNRILDNSVYLNWDTNYNNYRTSDLFLLCNKLLGYNQIGFNDRNKQVVWDIYFDWKLRSTSKKRTFDDAFMEFLRISLSRPRDFVVILNFIQDEMRRQGSNHTKFSFSAYNTERFRENYSEYFLTSLRDQLSFYYSESDYEHFVVFFDYFKSSEFDFALFKDNYEKFVDYILANMNEIPAFMNRAETFLQFLYDANIICSIKDDFFYFSYREKSKNNVVPKVKIEEGIRYRFHYGLHQKLKLR